MATMDDNPLFIDTKILVYANVIETPFHEQALAAINTAHNAGRAIWISRQVIREYLVTLTRPQIFENLPRANVINLSTKHLNSVRYFTSSSFTQEHFMSLSGPVPTTDLGQIQRII